METFKLKIQKKFVPSLRYVIGQKHLNIKIISEQPFPEPIPSGDPDIEIEIQLLSEDLGELVTLGWYAAKEPLSFTLGNTW
jgi:hypothetical protein